ncbi:MAG: hypothetical protein QXN59_01225 [Candidatus Micrarchaeaceae archaeon]
MPIKKKYRNYIIIAVVILLVAFGGIAYLAITLKSDISALAPVHKAPPPAIPTTLQYNITAQQALFYSSGSSIAPYLRIGYTETNLSRIYINVSLYKRPPPKNFYVLGVQNECINCGNIYLFIQDLYSELSKYNIANSTNIANVSISSVLSIQNYSVLVVPSGLIPSQLLSNIPGSNVTVLQSLLNRGVSIIYIGKNFSNSLIAGSIETPNTRLPYYLITNPTNATVRSSYYFDNPTFTFANGAEYGPISYENVSNGSIVAFSNYPNSWSNESSEAIDIAHAISALFWLPRFANGYANQTIPQNSSSGAIGIAMSNYTYPFSGEQSISQLNSGYGRIVVYNNYNYTPSAGSIYSYQYFFPEYSINGSVSIPNTVIPGYSVDGEFTIYTHSSSPIPLQPHLEVYSMNLSRIEAISLPYSSQSGNFTFYKSFLLNLPPGSYILSLESFSDAVYGSALFSVPQISISPISENYSSGQFKFRIAADGQPLQGIPYSIKVNSLYPSNGTIYNGTLYYKLPAGSPELFGNINFSISMLSSKFHYTSVNKPISIQISSNYVAIAVVAIIVLVLVTVVKAPSRDEFYIDVPAISSTEKTLIKLNPRDVLSSFDKLNLKYKWRYMPLSIDEVRNAISTSIKYGNIPVSLTFNNVNILLDQLAGAGLIVYADGLYAPKEWVDKSGHDIYYLATFKKLRMYLVTHGYLFTDLDASDNADMIITMHGERGRIIIYSKTSKFSALHLSSNTKTFLAFLNADIMNEFREGLSNIYSHEAEMLRLYISTGMLVLVNSDQPTDIVL